LWVVANHLEVPRDEVIRGPAVLAHEVEVGKAAHELLVPAALSLSLDLEELGLDLRVVVDKRALRPASRPSRWMLMRDTPPAKARPQQRHALSALMLMLVIADQKRLPALRS
jgi:hypothetical protein